MKTLIAILLLTGCGLVANVAGPIEDSRISLPKPAPEAITLDYSPPGEVRNYFYNHGNLGDPQGDCVQVSLGIHGVRCNEPRSALLAFNSQYGPAIRGGSGPSRVADYCRQRGIPIYNVTGSQLADTYAWACWAVRTGRGAAIGFGTRHFQTLMGFNKAEQRWLVCDNNTPWRVDKYTDAEFKAMHRASGYWIVILDTPAPPPPIIAILPKATPRPWLLFQGYEVL